ncbi:helix-turn-helix domain-containing protein [Streptomyces zaomyceticus]|uniref:helix-turn-helix domain-containing protein n=1 Tax=Streptomyces zaomyceticus TaxID=68286 RepID=UPI00324E5C8C
MSGQSPGAAAASVRTDTGQRRTAGQRPFYAERIQIGPPEDPLTTAEEDFARHLNHLHALAGAPSIRQLATRTGYGKSTIGEAFAGRRLPTWPLVEKLADALDADRDDLRKRWADAKGRPTTPAVVADWLTSVRTDTPNLAGNISFEDACAAAVTHPERAMGTSWDVLRVGALQMAHVYYGDIPGSWSSNVVETYERAEKDGLIPVGARAVANTVHHYYVGSRMSPAELPTTAELLQIVVLAYRLAWQARDVVDKRTQTVDRG